MKYLKGRGDWKRIQSSNIQSTNCFTVLPQQLFVSVCLCVCVCTGGVYYVQYSNGVDSNRGPSCGHPTSFRTIIHSRDGKKRDIKYVILLLYIQGFVVHLHFFYFVMSVSIRVCALYNDSLSRHHNTHKQIFQKGRV